MLTTFALEGITYSQQYRKCGKATCQTCQNGGPGHGPYWYARDAMTGARFYVGRDLPADVAAALVVWLLACGALGAAVALRGDWEEALTAWGVGLAVAGVVWYYEVRDNGQKNGQ